MRRLFFCIALAAGLLGLWGWDAGVVAAQKPPVATDTETAAKLDKLQWRLDELERKEREYLGLRERDQKETEKRLREFESGVKQEVEKETQNAKELVENKIKYFDLWLSFISIIATIAAASIPIIYRLLMRKIRKSERTASESLAKVVDIHEKAQNKFHDIQQVTENANILFSELKIATRDAKNQLDETRIATNTATILLEETQTAIHSAKQLLDDLNVEKEKLSSLLVTQTNPDAASSPSSRRAAKIASEQDEDTYSKFAGEALLAQEKGDYSAALKAWEEAASIDTNAAQAYFGIGLSKQLLARNAENTEKIQLLHEAKEAYLKAISITSDSHTSYNNLGNVLSDIALFDSNLSTQKRLSLFRNAFRQYEQALRIKPDYHTALNNWGVALGKLINSYLTPDPEERRKLLYEAFEKYEQACRIKPDYHEALNNWGIALLRISSPTLTEDEDERVRLLTLAGSKFLEARRLNPKIAGYNLACVASRTNKPEECQKWLEQSRLDEALPSCEHIRTDTDLDPVRNEQWFKDFLAEVCPEE